MPPTVALVAECFGHQFGAALASYLGGFVRVSLGDYTVALLGAGILAILAHGPRDQA